MNVFTPAERENHIQNIAQLFLAVKDIQEVENGYEFNFQKDVDLIQLADFIAKEKLCCPFLEFTLKIELDQKPISLMLTGPIGTPEFLREEFAEAFI